MSDAQRAELTARLREDAALRARLSAIARRDDALRAALLAPAELRGAPRSVLRVGALALSAAAVALLAVGSWWIGTRGGSLSGAVEPIAEVASAPPPLAEEPRFAVGPAATDDSILLQIPVRVPRIGPPASAANEARSKPATRVPPPVVAVALPLGARLLRGEAGAVLAEVESAAPEARGELYRELGDALRSAATAARVLDRMPPETQLEVCRAWAREPHLRTVAFERLRQLTDEPRLRAGLTTAVHDLHQTPALQPWLRSYRLEHLLPAPGSRPG